MGRFNWNFWVKRPHTPSFFQNNSALFRKKRELIWNTLFLSLEKPSFVRGFWHRLLSGVGHHFPLFYFPSFPFSQHSHFSLSPRHPLSPSPSQSLLRNHAANSLFPAFDAVWGQFGAGFGAILRVFWGSTGQYWERIWGRFWCRFWGKKEECIGFFPMHSFIFPRSKLTDKPPFFRGLYQSVWNEILDTV